MSQIPPGNETVGVEVSQQRSVTEQLETLQGQTDTELCAKIQESDQLAAEVLITRHHGFVRDVAVRTWFRRDKPVGADIDDLLQEGFLALLNAASRAERREDATFLTYAGVGVKNNIKRHLDNMESTVRIPAHVRPKLRQIQAVNSKRISQQRPLLNEQEISDLVDVPVSGPGFHTYDHIATGTLLRSILITRYMGSIDNGYSPARDTSPENDYVLDERNAVNSVTTEPEPATDDQAENSVKHKQLKEALETILTQLNDRDRKVLTLRFGLDGKGYRTLEEAGAELGVTRERIRQIESRVLSMMRYPHRSRNLWQFLD